MEHGNFWLLLTPFHLNVKHWVVSDSQDQTTHGLSFSIEHYKASLITHGLFPIFGLDFDENPSLVVKPISVCVLCALEVHLHFHLYLHFHFHFQLHLHHLDTNTASHNGDLVEELYILLPQGIEEHPGKLCTPWKSTHNPTSQTGFTYLDLLLDVELGKMGFSGIHIDFCTYFSSRITGFASYLPT
jgi:hypothetical protein